MRLLFVLFKNYKTLLTSVILLFNSIFIFGQKDTVSTTSFRNKLILYNDLGFNTAPFDLEIVHNHISKNPKFRNNIHDFYGVGCNYKIFSVRLGVQIPGSIKPTKSYGYSKYFHLGFDFTYKKIFFDFDFHQYKGFALMDSKQFYNNNYNSEYPNDIKKNLMSNSFSVNMWYFHKKNFTMSALRGKTAVFNKFAFTWYLKSTLNSFGLSNNNSPILPDYLIDTINTKSSATHIRAFDVGFIPGIALVLVKNHWNFSVLSGYGFTIQDKSYQTTSLYRNFIGLASRYDIRIMGGYNTPKWFLMLHTDFDNKSIQFSGLKYAQTYFSVRLVGGYRFGAK